MQPAPHNESIIIKQTEQGADTGRRRSNARGRFGGLGFVDVVMEGCYIRQNYQNKAFRVT
jgi:hypothetical protein